METSQNFLSNELQIDVRVARHLKETAGWAKFLGILGILLAALLAIAAFLVPEFFLKTYSGFESYDSYNSKIFSIAVTVGYLFAALLMFFIALFTFKFGSKTRQALALNDQHSLDSGLKNLKFLFRFYGIIAIIYIALLIIAFLLAALGKAFH